MTRAGAGSGSRRCRRGINDRYALRHSTILTKSGVIRSPCPHVALSLTLPLTCTAEFSRI
jgi:hypothetical protein